jgi:uncharacterized protein (TIGR02145 family)
MRNKLLFCCFTLTGILLTFSYSCKKSTDNPNQSINDSTMTDVENNTYKVITIGDQVWMAENLRSTKFRNGDLIPTSLADVSVEANPEYQWAYNADETLVPEYGRLYTWYTITESRNLCPLNWHIPTDLEWENLKTFLGGESAAGNKLKEAGTSHWESPNTNANNETGFTALPGGYRTVSGQFVSLHLSNYLWSTSPDSLFALGQGLHFDDALFAKGGYYRAAGVSVRCIRNN